MIIIARESLNITSDVAELASIRRFLRAYCQNLSDDALSEDDMAQLELAVNEAAANVMKHAYQGQTDQPVRVEITSDKEAISVSLIHKGITFEREEVPPPSFDGTRDNGFGVFLIEQCVDSVQYTQNEQGENCVSMMKYFTTNS